ncbi:hypothetical protein [Rhodovulum kholense]|uniref:Uncharacterized protein n=1 Tax=Rhodovulum kholense TaxID=453584 RepID=A0A8E2VG55_9RHOB|nr:hypothetical protein [Rhodovulum kholense]PTW35153.1 hypothetical protein C8N38_1383 [Rhodovulum kholense]
MNPSNFRKFDASEEPEPLIQQLGCILSPDRYYAVVRPEGAEPSDGEDRLLIRDDAFGPGIMQLDLDMELPTALIRGGQLSDPVDAIMLVRAGYILMLRDGLMRVEPIPSIAPSGTGEEFSRSRGQALGATIRNGKLLVVGSEGIVVQRGNDGEWEELNRQQKREDSYFALKGVTAASGGNVVAVGHRDYRSAYLCSTEAGDWEERTLPGGYLTDIVSTGPQDYWISARKGDLWHGNPVDGFENVTPEGTTTDFLAIAAYKERFYLTAAGGDLWVFGDGRASQIFPFPGERRFLTYSFDVHDDLLWVQGQNGFGMFDGESWTRINLPW